MPTLKEVRASEKVLISSANIEIGDRVNKVEILMKSLDGSVVHAVLWLAVICFNLKTGKSEEQPEELKQVFYGSLLD